MTDVTEQENEELFINSSKIPQESYLLKYFYEIPYTSLFFVKQNNAFYSRHQISFQLWCQNDLVVGKSYERFFSIPSYEETKLSTNVFLDSIIMSFITQGIHNSKLKLNVKINDLNSDNYVCYQSEFLLPKIVNKMIFYKNQRVNLKQFYSTDVLCPTKKSETLAIYFEIYTRAVKDCSLFIKKVSPWNRINVKDKNKFHSGIVAKFFLLPQYKQDSSAQFVSFTCPMTNFGDFSEGNYKVMVIGYDHNHSRVFCALDSFAIHNSFFNSDVDYQEMVDRLIYIATDMEMKKLKQADAVQRESLWKDFWKGKDLNPATEFNEAQEDYFAKIEYCIKHFAGDDRGYKSDRAKVYMKYGEPDFVESGLFERNRNAYEIWYYYRIARQFTFTDLNGFGVYVLTEVH